VSNLKILWIAFGVLVPVMLIIDLGVFHRRAHAIKVKEALIWSAVWICLSLLFNAAVYFMLGSEKALKFLTAYLVEKSLSIDNLFVFLLTFSYFNIPPKYQHKILFWGIIGALIMRALFIATGLVILEKLHWVIYIFGAFLIFTGIRMSIKKGITYDPEKNIVFRMLQRIVPITNDCDSGKFMTKVDSRLVVTPLLLVLVVIEMTDIVFAVDSIPAVLAITSDPFIIYTSNIFAILGLRALYFALAGVTQRLCYLHYGLSAILSFLGIKMILSAFLEIPIAVSLGMVIGILGVSAVASFVWPKKEVEY
jgi:tellurite resistance protein TerC